MSAVVHLNEELVKEAERVAADRGQSLASFLEDTLRERLMNARGRHLPSRVLLPTLPGWGLRPGIDLDDSAGLLEILEQPGAPD
jgi:hypothetical protein